MTEPEMIQVVMLPAHASAYRDWLRANNLQLFTIPTIGDDLPTFGVTPWSACCDGTGFADYAAVPCPDPRCPVINALTAIGRARW